MAVIDAVQDFSAEERVAALASVFIMVADHYGVRPSDAFTVAGNLLHDDGARTPEMRAAADYIRHELPR